MKPHTHAKSRNVLRQDPTRTTMLRRKFQSEMLRHIGDLKRDVWDFVVVQDALALEVGRRAPATAESLLGNAIALDPESSDQLVVLARPQPREFQFRTDAGKIRAFRDWLKEQVAAKVLRPVDPKDPSKPWTAPYIESAYKRGVVNAYARTKASQSLKDKSFFDKSQAEFIKTAFGQPETTSKLELLSTRTFEDLVGITDAMAQKLNRILADGMVEGLGPRDVARNMMDEIDGLTDKRALVLARTEIIHAHAEGQLDGMTELGVEEVGVEAEWATAGDDRVCPECEAMEGETFPIDEAHGLIPLHPNCRCTWVPAIPKSLLR